MAKIVFLDRDGTVIEDRAYLGTAEDVVLLPGAGEALKALQDGGYPLVLVTNQSGVARGYYPEKIVLAQHDRLRQLLEAFGVRLAAIKYCPHHPDDNCHCRKPKPGMLLEAGRELGADFAGSWMIGDSRRDVQAGKTAGCRSIIVGGEDVPEADSHADGLAEAARTILEYESA